MLFSAQQVIIWSSATTWFWDHAFMLGWCCGTEITPVLALKITEMEFMWKLMHLISLLDEAKLQFKIFLNRGKWAVHPWLIFSNLDTKRRREAGGTPVASHLPDLLFWLIVPQFETFIHIIHGMWKTYSCNLSNCFPSLAAYWCVVSRQVLQIYIQKGWLKQTCTDPHTHSVWKHWDKAFLYGRQRFIQ